MRKKGKKVMRDKVMEILKKKNFEKEDHKRRKETRGDDKNRDVIGCFI